MQLDIQEFLGRIQAGPLSVSAVAAEIVQEIRKVEGFKISLLEDVEAHPDFVVEISAKIDTYLFQLQELEKLFSFVLLPLDQQTALADEEVRKMIAARMETLRQLKNSKDPDA